MAARIGVRPSKLATSGIVNNTPKYYVLMFFRGAYLQVVVDVIRSVLGF